MDETTNELGWTACWLQQPLFGFVERVGAAGVDEDASSVRLVLDVVRANDVSGACRWDELATAQVVWAWPRQAGELPREGEWLSLELGAVAAGGAAAWLFRDLDGAEKIRVEPRRTELAASHARHLQSVCSLDAWPDAPIERLEQELGRSAVHVSAVRVGQGHCTALCCACGCPVLYVDQGAGCLDAADTRPRELSFCSVYNPPLLLSHWDFEHWAGAWFSQTRSEAKRVVVAPRQAIGPRTRKWAGQIELLLWPTELAELRLGRRGGAPALTVQRGLGEGKDGGALIVWVEAERGSVLLPADVPLERVPSPSRQGERRPLVGLVASPASASPCAAAPAAAPGAVLAWTGVEAPNEAACARLARDGWRRQLRTAAGSVVLGGARARARCGRHCPLEPAQA